MVYKTLKEWNKAGFWVKRGEKHVGWLHGEACFTKDQVRIATSKRNQKYENHPSDYDVEWEAEKDELTADSHHYGWGSD